MRVLILTQYFTPEICAPSARLHTFARGLAREGHEVEVVCEVPNYPQGVVHPSYRGRAVTRRRMDGFRVAWVWVYTKREKTTRDRLALYGSYAAMATGYASLRARPDVIFASSPPLSVGAAAAALARRHRVPWVMDVRDLWPAAAVALGQLIDERALRVAERLERFLYRDAAAVTVVTAPFAEHVERLTTTPVHLIPNGTTQFWLDAGRAVPDRARAQLSDRFTWTFAGNVGLAQGLETAVEAAQLLGDDFRLLILGEGSARLTLERQVAEQAPGLVEFRAQVPKERAAVILRASDALLVSLSPSPALEAFVPSKLFDCCAITKPVVLAVAGEATRRASGAGAALPVA
ncbi:MAG: glycosyltransferase family 4 protein, partial [Solirubrobacterales bacterium]|nr:glycosyltransferase family 4 protein [Solirubrobacterales bacterium]